MSPIDDELRSLLNARADLLAPAPDPLAGIEGRARRMRRNRAAAAIAGTALAVASVAAVVPAVLPDQVRDGGSTQFADPTPTSPTPTPSPSASTQAEPIPPSGLDPANPWPYRGNPALIAGDNVSSLRAEWQAANHPGSEITPLVGLENASSGLTEIAFVATAKGVNTFAVATSSEAGWEVLYEKPFAAGATALMAALPGDEVPRLLVVASPRTIGDISYAADGTSFVTASGPFPGVSFVPLEGDTSKDAVRVLDGNGDLDKPLYLGPAPDYKSAQASGTTRSPDNLVSWPTRGAEPNPAFWEKAVATFATGMGVRRGDVEAKRLFAGDDDSRNVFVFGQAWVKGSDAHTFGYSVNADGEATPFLGPVTPKGVQVLAFVFGPGTGQSRETLVVIPDPAAAETHYGPAASEYDRITGQDYLGGVSLIDRFPDGTRNGDDMLKLLAADGRKLFEGTVGSLLCGLKGCG